MSKQRRNLMGGDGLTALLTRNRRRITNLERGEVAVATVSHRFVISPHLIGGAAMVPFKPLPGPVVMGAFQEDTFQEDTFLV